MKIYDLHAINLNGNINLTDSITRRLMDIFQKLNLIFDFEFSHEEIFYEYDGVRPDTKLKADGRKYSYANKQSARRI